MKLNHGCQFCRRPCRKETCQRIECQRKRKNIANRAWRERGSARALREFLAKLEAGERGASKCLTIRT